MALRLKMKAVGAITIAGVIVEALNFSELAPVIRRNSSPAFAGLLISRAPASQPAKSRISRTGVLIMFHLLSEELKNY